MPETLGRALAAFHEALGQLRAALAEQPLLEAEVFADSDAWIGLLAYKLVPHLAGEGCLVAAVAGGANTGKSTVFNMLLGADTSPVRYTAAATAHPVLAANAMRYAQCLEGKLVPEFAPAPLEEPERVLESGGAADTLFVTCAPGLPDSLVLLDTPDIDSIEKANWEVAGNIRMAGDVLIALLTAEKYKDDRVVRFFQQARASGRVVVPVMNKADPRNDFEVARVQLADFCGAVGLDAPDCFVVPHDFGLAGDFAAQEISPLDGRLALRAHLESIDVMGLKTRVYQDTLAHFAAEARDFLARTAETASGLNHIIIDFEGRAATFAQRYDPAPGAQVGGLFHQFVQSKRGPAGKAIGAASSAVARTLAAAGKRLGDALFRRSALEDPGEDATDEQIRTLHHENIERLVRELAASYFDTARNLRGPAAALVRLELEALDMDAIAAAVIGQTVQAESISEDFARHAQRLLEAWWDGHAGKRRIILALDRVLLLAPAAIAGAMSLHTAGVGVAETMVIAGPLAEQFTARIVEYQFGDAMFDFLSPWRKEQREALEGALRDHLAGPALQSLTRALGPINADALAQMEGLLEPCLKTT